MQIREKKKFVDTFSLSELVNFLFLCDIEATFSYETLVLLECGEESEVS